MAKKTKGKSAAQARRDSVNARTERMQELVRPARAGDPAAVGELWLLFMDLAGPIVRNYITKYPFVDRDDLTNGVATYFPQILKRYDPDNSAGNSFSKYSYHRIFFTCKDLLRLRDDLGIKYPQKKMYPQWSHFSSFEGKANSNMHDRLDFEGREMDPLDQLIASEESSNEPMRQDLADLQSAVEPSAEQPKRRRSKLTDEQRKERNRLANQKLNEKRKAERRAAKNAKNAELPKAKESASLVDVKHLRAARALVDACGSPGAARHALDCWLSI